MVEITKTPGTMEFDKVYTWLRRWGLLTTVTVAYTGPDRFGDSQTDSLYKVRAGRDGQDRFISFIMCRSSGGGKKGVGRIYEGSRCEGDPCVREYYKSLGQAISGEDGYFTYSDQEIHICLGLAAVAAMFFGYWRYTWPLLAALAALVLANELLMTALRKRGK